MPADHSDNMQDAEHGNFLRSPPPTDSPSTDPRQVAPSPNIKLIFDKVLAIVFAAVVVFLVECLQYHPTPPAYLLVLTGVFTCLTAVAAGGPRLLDAIEGFLGGWRKGGP